MRDIRFLLKTHYTNSRALLIGINKYESAPPLAYAVNDAQGVRDTLINDLSFPPENITFLADQEATKINILRSFMKLTTDDIDLDERLIIFFAGHGHTRSGIRGEVGYLVPCDADMKDFSSFIRWDELTGNSELIRAKHVLFIMDACYGGLALTRTLQPGSTRFLKDMMLRYSRQVLTAGKANEVVADSGGPLPNHSIFTGHLIEGIQGKAIGDNGVLTASGLMSYVYSKVSNDKNSKQSPHYGYFDGDGDLILRAPQINTLEKTTDKDFDDLIVIPFTDDDSSIETTSSKIKRIKSLLASDTTSIELHDFVVGEVRRFLSATSDDNFKVQGSYSLDELIERITKYEAVTNDLAMLTACISYWARPVHKSVLQKVLARSTDRMEAHNGLQAWICLRWYPVVLELYCSGISAIEGNRYDSLANIFYATVSSTESRDRTQFFVEAVADAILELTRRDVFKQLPGHERQYTPMSEYLFKILQPKLDDILFIGMNYENSFDHFEVLFALVVADLNMQKDGHVWGPVGRFGWKRGRGDNSPLTRLINEVRAAGDNWQGFAAGFFGGSLTRFNAVADAFQERVSKLGWW